MKKLLLGLTVAALASTAAADQVGGYLFGIQYQQDNGLRYGLGLPLVSVFGGSATLAVNGDVSYLIPFDTGADTGNFSTYYGFGLGAGVYLGGGAGFSLYPNVLAGVNFNNTSDFTPFLEASAGPSIGLGTGGGGIGLGYGLRLGVNYRLP
ncbi:hypothetical protein [Deinococcus sonorensis]|uniref:Outer membrane protein beta-barrel domain-containing protein n=2 Tax=Deinococcus sonorensis TaxID=309891 RepID=A0AAU7U985_9DEIO